MRHAYNHRVAIEERLETGKDDDTGAVIYEWVTVALDSETELEQVPAEVLLGPGRELLAADTKLAETTARINMPWFPGLRADMRIVWEGRYFDILEISADASARREYRLRCRDGVSDGA